MLDESKFVIMPPVRNSRPAQIPVRADRFKYLTEVYKPGDGDSSWVMFHHPGHFMIYDRESRRCVFDGTYGLLGEPENQPDDELVAVVFEIRINCDPAWHPVTEQGDGFSVFSGLIRKDL